MTILRQGDVLLVKTSKRALSATATMRPRDHGRVVLAYGEVTGHAHAIDSALAELFDERDGRLYLRIDVGAPVALVHEEHAAIALDPGIYRVMHQTEYTPAELRRVAD